jgi:hypothetical protein
VRTCSEKRTHNRRISRFRRQQTESKFGFVIFSDHHPRYSNVVEMQFHSQSARLRGLCPHPAIIESVGSTNHRSGPSARIEDGRVRG